jgi:hypothetical protein
MVLVVLDAPGLKGVNEGHEHQRAHDVLHQLVLAKGAVAAVMPNHKPLHDGEDVVFWRMSGVG